MWEVLKHCWVSQLVSRELIIFNWFLSHRHHSTQPHPQRMWLHDAIVHNMEWEHETKFFKELLFSHLFKTIVTELMSPADTLAKDFPLWFYRSWWPTAEWTVKHTCLLYTTLMEYTGEEGSSSNHSITICILPPRLDPLLTPRKRMTE